MTAKPLMVKYQTCLLLRLVVAMTFKVK